MLLLEEQPEDPVLAEELDDVPGELVRLVDLGGAGSDPIARERAHELPKLALLLGQGIPAHTSVYSTFQPFESTGVPPGRAGPAGYREEHHVGTANARTVEKVGVVGLGTMGSGIAQLCVQAGVPTVACESTMELAERGRGMIEKQLARSVEKGRLSEEEKERTLGLLEPAADVGALEGCDLVIEAVFEDLAVKHDLFARIEGVVAHDTVLATNTSALSVTEIAAPLAHPERVVGMHFFNPAPVLPLVEVIRGELTSGAAFDTAYAFAEHIGKDPIACDDTPGFVVNRILIPVLNDAVQVLEEGTASAEDIDKGMRLGTGWPIGPLALIDLIGIDVHVHVCEALWNAYREPKFAPPPRLVRMTKAGLLGRKSGQGFYTYDR